jgi:hypothetical protein
VNGEDTLQLGAREVDTMVAICAWMRRHVESGDEEWRDQDRVRALIATEWVARGHPSRFSRNLAALTVECLIHTTAEFSPRLKWANRLAQAKRFLHRLLPFRAET